MKKQMIYVPTRAGWLVLLALVALLSVAGAVHIYPFLAVDRPQPDARIWIVEAWMGDAALREVLATMEPGHLVLCAGGPITHGAEILPYDNYAQVGAERLAAMGVPREQILVAPAPPTRRDRTYASARAAREKLEDAGLFGEPVNLCSIGAHARRSRLMYRKAFGSDYPLGILSLSPEEFGMENWYRYSSGFKMVLSEWFSWIYSLLFFRESA